MGNAKKLKLFAIVILILIAGASATAQWTWRVNIDSAGQESIGWASFPRLTRNARFVVFDSPAPDLVTGDSNGTWDVFLHDRWDRSTRRISVDSSGNEADGRSQRAVVSADGLWIAFESEASNLVTGDQNRFSDIFLHDVAQATTIRVSRGVGGVEADSASIRPVISATGQFVAFESFASNLVSADTNSVTDVFVHDRLSGNTVRISVDSSGVQADGPSGTPALDSSGAQIAFTSDATNLVLGDGNGLQDVFVHDLGTGRTERVSVSSQGDEALCPGPVDGSGYPAISADGRFVGFSSCAFNLVPSDTNQKDDVFLHDRLTGQTLRVSQTTAGVDGDGDSRWPALSADGSLVAFQSFATNLVASDTNGVWDILLWEKSGKTLRRVSLSSSGVEGNGTSAMAHLAADGRTVAFQSAATNLVPADTNNFLDLFVHGSQLTLDTQPLAPQAGGQVECHLWEGTPASPLALFVVGVDGAPVLHLLDYGFFSGASHWSSSYGVPPGHSGESYTLQAFAFGYGGPVIVSNAQTLTLQ